MNIQQTVFNLRQQYNVLSIINLRHWNNDYEISKTWLFNELRELYRPEFNADDRIILIHEHDYYVKNDVIGLIIKNLQIILNDLDIPSCFICVVTTSKNANNHVKYLSKINSDPANIIEFISVNGDFHNNILDKHPYSRSEEYAYGSANPIKISLNDISPREKFLLSDSKTFCMYPWIHLHAWPTGQAFPCCYAEPVGQVGDCRTHTLKEIWNNDATKKLRQDMLAEMPNVACARCYEQEASGFFSGRQSANKHHGHHITRVDETQPDGTLEHFEMTYWDIRFSNLCNLSCRSCGHIFSSSWYQDQTKLAGPSWAAANKPLNIAGRTKTDMWEQLIPHLDYVEQIYFAGGEPLMMEEHYNILDELERRGRFDVRLVYNTNFTQTKLKDRVVFDYWRKFDSVAVGASLDAMGPRAEYIRKGTDWATVERNRELMMEICPTVDFYISPTLSIMNALHLPTFHKTWVEKGYIKPQDLNVNILQDPSHLRIDIAPVEYKQHIRTVYEEHLEWLRPLDPLNRATVGFKSAINFMMATDNTALIPKFWSKAHQLDTIRGEEILQVIPELKDLL